MSCCWINELVNSWQGKAIFCVSIVQVHEIHAHSPFPIRLFYHNNVGQPIRIVDFLDEIGSKQLIHLIHYCSVLLKGKDPSSLLDWFSLRIHIQTLLNDICWYTGHVFVASCKDVQVLFQKKLWFFSSLRWLGSSLPWLSLLVLLPPTRSSLKPSWPLGFFPRSSKYGFPLRPTLPGNTLEPIPSPPLSLQPRIPLGISPSSNMWM